MHHEYDAAENIATKHITFFSEIKSVKFFIKIDSKTTIFIERGGAVVECRTPNEEVLGSIPTSCFVLEQDTLTPYKIVDRDVKPKHKQ